jgi:hypothetical protein
MNSVMDDNQKYLIGSEGNTARAAQQAQRNNLAEQISNPIGHGRVIARREDNGEVIFQDNNIIVNTTKYLFAFWASNYAPGEAFTPQNPYQFGQTPANSANPQPNHTGPLFGIWGLALGTGSPTWAPQTQPTQTPQQTALISQVLRKGLSSIQFVDSNFNPLPNFSLQVSFQTILNATTDNLIGVGIREMGLIGGGQYTAGSFTGTNMLTAPYFVPPNSQGVPVPNLNSVVLVNYITTPPIILPAGINIIIEWILQF